MIDRGQNSGKNGGSTSGGTEGDDFREIEVPLRSQGERSVIRGWSAFATQQTARY